MRYDWIRNTCLVPVLTKQFKCVSYLKSVEWSFVKTWLQFPNTTRRWEIHRHWHCCTHCKRIPIAFGRCRCAAICCSAAQTTAPSKCGMCCRAPASKHCKTNATASICALQLAVLSSVRALMIAKSMYYNDDDDDDGDFIIINGFLYQSFGRYKLENLNVHWQDIVGKCGNWYNLVLLIVFMLCVCVFFVWKLMRRRFCWQKDNRSRIIV